MSDSKNMPVKKVVKFLEKEDKKFPKPKKGKSDAERLMEWIKS